MAPGLPSRAVRHLKCSVCICLNLFAFFMLKKYIFEKVKVSCYKISALLFITCHKKLYLVYCVYLWERLTKWFDKYVTFLFFLPF